LINYSKVLKKILLTFLFSVLLIMPFAHAEDAWLKVQKTGELRWGADTAGGAPYVFFHENDPQHLIGFEIEIVEKIAKKLGVKAVLVPSPWEQLVSALNRGNFDAVINGLEITEPRKQVVRFSRPYYFLTEQLTVQKKTKSIKGLSDLKNKKVGTMSASLAQRILEQDPQIIVVTYPGPVEVYKDLEIGRKPRCNSAARDRRGHCRGPSDVGCQRQGRGSNDRQARMCYRPGNRRGR
jgi:polar amino acid transport system substrate-binding protein